MSQVVGSPFSRPQQLQRGRTKVLWFLGCSLCFLGFWVGPGRPGPTAQPGTRRPPRKTKNTKKKRGETGSLFFLVSGLARGHPSQRPSDQPPAAPETKNTKKTRGKTKEQQITTGEVQLLESTARCNCHKRVWSGPLWWVDGFSLVIPVGTSLLTDLWPFWFKICL